MEPLPVGYTVDYFESIVFKDPELGSEALNYDSHVERAEQRRESGIRRDGRRYQTASRKRGGKLIMYQGWAEPGIPPGNLVKYSARFKRRPAARRTRCASSWSRGWGTVAVATARAPPTWLAALDGWRDGGKAPEQVNASRVRDGKVDRTRPFCAWPAVAKYKGSGSVDVAANFACR